MHHLKLDDSTLWTVLFNYTDECTSTAGLLRNAQEICRLGRNLSDNSAGSEAPLVGITL